MSRREPRLPPLAPDAGEDEIWLRTAAFAIRKMRQMPETVRPSLYYAQAALAALAPLRQAERERAWHEGAEATCRALAGWAEARGATKLAEAMRAFPLPPMGGV